MDAMAKAGIELPLPPPDRPSLAVRAYRERTAGTSRYHVKVFSRDWLLCVDEDTQRVVYYQDNATPERSCSRYWELKEQKDFDPAKHEQPRITREEAMAIFERQGYMKVFGMDVDQVEFGGLEVSFTPWHEQRGWRFTRPRVHKGYAIVNEEVQWMINDEEEVLIQYNRRISDAVPPDPVVRLTSSALPEVIDGFLAEAPVTARVIPARGYTRRPGSLSVEGPRYVHANFAYHDEKGLTYSLDFPLRLVYECVFVGDSPGKRTYRFRMWVDTATGEIVGGDFGE